MSCLAENQLNKSMVNVTAGEHPAKTYEIPVVGRWLIVQQRLDFNVSFYQPWISYRQGLQNYPYFTTNTDRCTVYYTEETINHQPVKTYGTIIQTGQSLQFKRFE